MPKKWKGENPKAAEARERKESKKQGELDRKQRAEEDAYWHDDDKHLHKKEQRKLEKESKRQTVLERKKEAQQLLAEEESKLTGKSATAAGVGGKKVTRAEIQEAQEKEVKERQKLESYTAGASAEFLPLHENPNHLLLQRKLEGHHDAGNIDEAIEVLTVSDKKVDIHPEKRLKAAYAAFEDRELPKLKSENPNLRLSQLKQLLKKEWMKSPDNPMNQLT